MKYVLDYTNKTVISDKIIKAIYKIISNNFKMKSELDGRKIKHVRKMKQSEVNFIKGFISGLIIADYDLDY
jgi:hypothetical protein